ncbi:MAG: hypothetical protein A2Y97_11710 [Nitrospirae bacterium RBG_13_39_12]|nr:MAG: hypothetical protein A2Y97_11710 [Nitrospirae bacterium RBG_13_39_12]
MGLGKKIGAPGLDALIFRGLECFLAHEKTGPFPDTTLPGDIERIVGTWSGLSDVDGTTWRFTFEQNYAVYVSSSAGYYCQGTAFVHWKLGLTDGAVRVPPGWSVLDLDVIQSSELSHRNNISLGAYSSHENLLKYCFCEPGRMVRPITDESREGIRCFELTKVGAGGNIPAGRPPSVPEKSSSVSARNISPLGPSTEGPLSPLMTGTADIIIDGVREIFTLRTDPGSTTDVSNPHRSTLQFQSHGAQFPSARRIEITFDATKTGRHYADGFAYVENLFMAEKIPVGSEISGEPAAVFLYIADGGRIFPPRLSCDVNIMAPGTGSDNILFEGSLSDCTVSSAGESHTMSSVKFSVRGRNKR